jgi:Peptidase family S41
MSRISLPVLVIIGAASGVNGWAQSPTTASPGTPVKSATVVKAASTSSAEQSRSAPTGDLLESLTPADVQTAIALLKKNFTNSEALDDTQLNRAMLQGLLVRLSKGLVLLPAKSTGAAETPTPFYAELLENHVGYIRPGTMSAPNLQALDKKLADFAAKKADALIIDLRASDTGDFATAAEFAKRFIAKGKTLFSLRKQGKQERTFMSDRDPAYSGLIVVLADEDTVGPAEALVAALRSYDKALIIGQPTAGGGVEYSDLPLPSGKILRVAVAECTGADGRALYPNSLKPDLSVEMSGVDKRQIFRASVNKGIAQFTHEMERPHLNEAALIAGTNPELESSEQRRMRAQANALIDPVLQRALDLITSLEIYQKR